ncbi:hypothetical protein pipiens_003016 [Culex pipiens pipiens]|uniref:DUF4780 domain-containing protein n=1 Tax=Culex pipiens pipiens TaxID=38569 RepID=A0ABD1D7W3_CULPP
MECGGVDDGDGDDLEDQLGDLGLDGGSSVSSSVLDSPQRSMEVDAPEDQSAGPGIPPGDNDSLHSSGDTSGSVTPTPVDPAGSNRKRRKPGKPKMTNAQLRRMDYFVRNGHPPKEARKLALVPVEQNYLNKRQRSKDEPSPNSSGQGKGPDKKRIRNRGSEGPAPPPAAQAGMISYKEVAEAIHVAVIPLGYPAKTLTTEELKAIRTQLLDLIIKLETPVVRPKYRNCTFKYGYLILACADEATAGWTKEVVNKLQPWEGAELVAVNLADLPKQVLFLGYFQDSLQYTSEDIIRLVQNQNDDFRTEQWKVARRTEHSKTIELLIEMDEKSAEQVAAQHFQLNYTFGKARLRKVTGSTANSDQKDSATLTGKVQTEHVPQPPAQDSQNTERKGRFCKSLSLNPSNNHLEVVARRNHGRFRKVQAQTRSSNHLVLAKTNRAICKVLVVAP